jgi:hypothetical protein
MLYNFYKEGYRIYKLKDVFPIPISDREIERLCNRLQIRMLIDDKNNLVFIK